MLPATDGAEYSAGGDRCRWSLVRTRSVSPTATPPSTSESPERDGHRAGVSDGTRPARSERRSTRQCSVSVILPTYNEAANLAILLNRLTDLLADLDYEIIVVDDNSPDGTWEIAHAYAAGSPRIKSIRRLTDRGLSSAVMAGMEIAKGRVFAVMDSDLQHDEGALIDIITPVLDGEADVCLGSREAEGGSYGEWSKFRRIISWVGAQLARRLLGVPISDPMSGYFAVSRDRYLDVADEVNPRGFKILLEFVARGPRPRVAEVGYGFRERVAGESNLTSSVVGAYLVALIDLFVGRVVSATFTAYALVGLLGVAIRFTLLLTLTATGFAWPALAAFQVSVFCNYVFNNSFTFAPERRRGVRAWTGLVPHQLIALHGLMVQAGVAAFAGYTPSELPSASISIQLVGTALATTGNYHLNRNITWRS